MRPYSFTITVDRFVDDLDDIDALYGRCPDSTVETVAQTTLIHFDREAESLDKALHSAIADLQVFGYKAERIEIEPACIGVS